MEGKVQALEGSPAREGTILAALRTVGWESPAQGGMVGGNAVHTAGDRTLGTVAVVDNQGELAD